MTGALRNTDRLNLSAVWDLLHFKGDTLLGEFWPAPP